MKRLCLEIGRVNGFCYPTHNRLDLPLEFAYREVEFISVRDMSREPLELVDFLAAPMIRRGRQLMLGRDMVLNEERQFYLEAIQGRKLPALRLGLYDPKCPGEGPLSFIPQLFAPTAAGMKLLARTIRDFRTREPHKWTGNPFRLAIFPEVKPCRSAS